jgi:hypothetical protein
MSNLKLDSVSMVMLDTSKIHPFILDFMKGQEEFIDNSGTLNESIYFASFFDDFQHLFIPTWNSVANEYKDGSETQLKALEAIDQWHELEKICRQYFYCCLTGQ